MLYNYLDALPIDLLNKILDINVDDIEKQISILENKLTNLEVKLSPLNITKYKKHLEITYGYVFYNLKEKLYNRLNGDIVLLNIYNDLFGGYHGITYVSKVLHNPTYLDILIEANKSVIKTKDYYHKYLDGLYKLDTPILYNSTGIVGEKNIKYYEIMMGS